MLFTRRDLPHIQRDIRALFVTFMLKAGRMLTPQMRDIVLDHCLHDHGKRYESFDHVVRSDADFQIHFIYIFENAFSVSGSGKPNDYPWLWTPGER